MRIIYEFENVEEYLEYTNANAHTSKNKHEQTNISVNVKTSEKPKSLEIDEIVDYFTKASERTLFT